MVSCKCRATVPDRYSKLDLILPQLDCSTAVKQSTSSAPISWPHGLLAAAHGEVL